MPDTTFKERRASARPASQQGKLVKPWHGVLGGWRVQTPQQQTAGKDKPRR
jgi:hypothetical protein